MQFSETVFNSPSKDSPAMAQIKTKRTWCPSLLQMRVGVVTRLTAEREAARIPWPQLHGAGKRYVLWEALALWVQAIQDAEGDFTQWLAEVVDKRCRGFSKFAGGADPPTIRIGGPSAAAGLRRADAS